MTWMQTLANNWWSCESQNEESKLVIMRSFCVHILWYWQNLFSHRPRFSVKKSNRHVIFYLFMSRDSAVGIATGYGLDGRDSIPERGRVFLPFIASRPALGYIQPPTGLVPRTISRRDKAAGHEPGHSPPPISEVKNGEAVLLLPRMSSWRGA
jgi:hypothetical protein